MNRSIPLFALGLSCLSPVSQGSPIISEFLAANESILADAEGRFPDWVEIHHSGDEAMDLGGYVLADADGEWAFPAGVMVEPGGYLVVFASGRGGEEEDALGYWHTDFRLARSGESLSLRSPSGEVLSQFEEIPAQRTDVSFGVASNESVGYFEKPTPGDANGVVILGYVGDTKFSVDRGYHEEPLSVTIEVEPADASILYTTDGTDPDKGTIFTGPIGEIYEGPIEIASTTVLKAMAYKNGWRSSNVDAQTYVFLDDVLRQPLEAPEGYPDRWGGQLADYGMDEEVVDDPAYKDDFEEAFRVFPSLSISMDKDDMFGSKGIYQNTTQEGPDWERAAMAEFIFPDDPGDSFHVPCGIRIQGGSSRNTDIPKHSFSLRFRERYGLGELNAPLFREAPFGESAVERFDFLQLRSGFNFAWTHRHYYQSRHAQYNRDQFVNDLYLAMGHPGVHGRWFHLYINGLYWGMFHVHERPDANFMASYFGGSKEDYDAVNSGQATDGNLTSWNAMWALARNADEAEVFEELEERLEIDALIDYMLLNFYVGNWDWDGHNWRAAGPHQGSEELGPWYFFPWDSEFAISPNGAGVINSPAPIENALTIDRTRAGGGSNRPTGLHQTLLDSPFYKERLADRVQKHFFNGGVFTPERATAIWKARSDVMDVAVIAESARWGDYKRDLVPGRWPAANYDLYTKNDHYLPNQKFILERYLPERTDIVLQQLREARLISNAEAPVFEVGGETQFGGVVPQGETVRVLGKGSVSYSIDGETDPRDPEALSYAAETGIVLQHSALIRARSRSIFGQWSPLIEAFFIVGRPAAPGDLVVSEIHYHPAAPSEVEREAGFAVRSEFEFLELLHVGDGPINLIGAEFVKGISYAFDEDVVLDPGERVLLVRNREAFALRYPQAVGAVVGAFTGGLRNSGERLEMFGSGGETLVRVRYDDEGLWPEAADGDGYSLVLRDPEAASEPDDGEQWMASPSMGGSPGESDDDVIDPVEPSGYLGWREEVFTEAQLGDEQISGPLGDGDGDGRATVFVYVAGSSPAEADGEPFLEVVSGEGGEVSVRWVQRRAIAGVSFALEISGDLREWEPLEDSMSSRTEEPLDADRNRVSIRLDRADGRRYLRAVATVLGD